MRGDSNRPTSRRMVEARDREAKAWELCLRGLTLAQIARQTGYSHASGARKAILRHMKVIKPDAVDVAERRALMQARIDARRAAVWRILDADDYRALAAIDRLARADADERALWGLDAPASAAVGTHLAAPIDEAELVASLERVIDEMEREVARLEAESPRLDAEASRASRLADLPPGRPDDSGTSPMTGTADLPTDGPPVSGHATGGTN